MSTPIFPATTIKFEALPLDAGNNWQVVATLPTGQQEEIGEFNKQAEALAWIGSPKCWAWMKLRGYE